jgi:hypothetical protein
MQTETFLNCTLEQSLLLEELGFRSSMRCPSTSTIKAWLFLEYGIFIQTQKIKYNYQPNYGNIEEKHKTVFVYIKSLSHIFF